MTHELETGFFVRTPAWHKLGIVLPDAPSVADALRLAGLDWAVEIRPLFTALGLPVESHRAVTRVTDGRVLGVVGNSYHPLQNAAAFRFFEPFVETGACRLESAGSLKEGRRVWVLARVRDMAAEVVDGDTVTGYFLLSNAHDGSQAVRAQFTPIRVVCANTLGMADRRAEMGVDASLRVRHTTRVEEGLTFVQKTVDMAHRTFSATVEMYRQMASRPLPVGGLRDYVSELLEVSPEMRMVGVMPKAWEIIQQAYFAGPGSSLRGVFGTYWGAYNAVTDWVDHRRGVRGAEARLDSAWFGDGVRIKRRALELALT